MSNGCMEIKKGIIRYIDDVKSFEPIDLTEQLKRLAETLNINIDIAAILENGGAITQEFTDGKLIEINDKIYQFIKYEELNDEFLIIQEPTLNNNDVDFLISFNNLTHSEYEILEKLVKEVKGE